MTKFAVKKAQIEILERFAKVLEEMRNDTVTDYRVIGKEDEQATSWKTGEPLWEDAECTIPKYRDKWGSVPLTDEEMTDEKKAMLVALEEMEKALDKLV